MFGHHKDKPIEVKAGCGHRTAILDHGSAEDAVLTLCSLQMAYVYRIYRSI